MSACGVEWSVNLSHGLTLMIIQICDYKKKCKAVCLRLKKKQTIVKCGEKAKLVSLCILYMELQ